MAIVLRCDGLDNERRRVDWLQQPGDITHPGDPLSAWRDRARPEVESELASRPFLAASICSNDEARRSAIWFAPNTEHSKQLCTSNNNRETRCVPRPYHGTSGGAHFLTRNTGKLYSRCRRFGNRQQVHQPTGTRISGCPEFEIPAHLPPSRLFDPSVAFVQIKVLEPGMQ